MSFLDFYGLKDDPFRLSPDPLYFFQSSAHMEALSSLEYIITHKEGFCLVSGEPGTGKTTLINVFMDRWKDRASVALIVTPRLSSEEFFRCMLDDLGVKSRKKNKADLLKAFRDFLVKRSEEGVPVVVIVDEAQQLPDDTLEELRLLSNLETGKEKLLQIILIGQTELDEKLKKDNLRQLDQRITVRVRLKALSGQEMIAYINHRLVRAGRGFIKLDDKTVRYIQRLSRGIPRVVNMVLSRALMSAYLEGSHDLTIKHARYAVTHLECAGAGSRPGLTQGRMVYYGLGVAAFLMIAFVGSYLFV